MADRAVEVRLLANVAQYKASMLSAASTTEAAMARAAKATTRQEAALKSASAAGHLAFSAMKVGAVGAIGTMALAAKVTSDFEARMANVKALSHANAIEMRALRTAAMSAGTGYGYTASEVADAEAEMVKAGVSLRDMMGGGLKGALALAAAGQVDVADATEIAASAMTQFRLKGRDLPHVADLLAAGADKALGSVTDLGYGLSQAGTTAHQMGFSIEDTVGTLAEFAQAGQQGEKGGTLLNQMLLQLAAPTDKAQKLMDSLHLSLYKANGDIKTMPELAGNMQRSFKGLDKESRNAALGVIFGSRAIRGANILLADGEKVNRRWIKAVDDQGFAAHQASSKLDSLNGDLQKLKAAGENALIALGSGEQAPLRNLVRDASRELAKLTESGDLERWGKKAGETVEAVAHDIGSFAKNVAPAIGDIGHAIHGAIEDFNAMPADLRKLLVYGGAGAVVGHKLGLDSLAKTLIVGPSRRGGAAGLAGGLVSGKAGVVPVFVTNKGFDGKDGPGGGKGVPGGGAAGTLLAAGGRTPYGAIAAGVGIPSYAFTKWNYPNGGAIGGGRFGDIARGNINLPRPNLSAFRTGVSGGGLGDLGRNVDYGSIASGLKHVTQVALGMKSGFDKSSDAASSFGAVLQHAVKDVADSANPVIAKTGLTVRQMVVGFKSMPKGVQIKLATPGAVKSRADVEALAKQFHLTPKEVRVLLRLSGVKEAEKNTVDVGRALRDVGKQHPTPKVHLSDTASPKLGSVRRLLDDVGQQHPKPKADLNDKASPAARRLAAYLRSVGALHPRPSVSVNDQASGTLNRIRGLMGGITSRTVTFTTIHRDLRVGGASGISANPTHNADGGTIDGPRYPYGDKVLTMLAPGEEVISNRHGQADRFRADRAAGRIPGYAEGGTVRRPALTASAAEKAADDRARARHDRALDHSKGLLDRFSGSLDNARSGLQDLRSAAKDFRTAIKEPFTHDLFGNGLAGVQVQLEADRNDARSFLAAIKTGERKGLSGPFEKALLTSGDLNTAQQLAGASRGQIAGVERLYAQRASDSSLLAQHGGDRFYAKQIADQVREVKHLSGVVAHLNKTIGGLEKAVQRGTAEGARQGTREGMDVNNKAAAQRRRVNK